MGIVVHTGRVTFADDAYEACRGASALVLVTEWREYQNPNFARLKGTMAEPVIFDGRNIWSSYDLAKHGFEYFGIGSQGTKSV